MSTLIRRLLDKLNSEKDFNPKNMSEWRRISSCSNGGGGCGCDFNERELFHSNKGGGGGWAEPWSSRIEKKWIENFNWTLGQSTCEVAGPFAPVFVDKIWIRWGDVVWPDWEWRTASSFNGWNWKGIDFKEFIEPTAVAADHPPFLPACLQAWPSLLFFLLLQFHRVT